MDLIINGNSVEQWHHALLDNSNENDFLVFYSIDDDYLWFITQYIQYISRDLTGTEIVPLYGKQIGSLKSFMYQINFCLPVGFRMKANFHALYDLVLNFETEPKNRFIFWNDTDHLLQKNKKAFAEIFEALIVAAFVNRNGIGTVKENGNPYKVNQRNFFFFKEENITEVKAIQAQNYFIPPYGSSQQIPFNTVWIK